MRLLFIFVEGFIILIFTINFSNLFFTNISSQDNNQLHGRRLNFQTTESFSSQAASGIRLVYLSGVLDFQEYFLETILKSCENCILDDELLVLVNLFFRATNWQSFVSFEEKIARRVNFIGEQLKGENKLLFINAFPNNTFHRLDNPPRSHFSANLFSLSLIAKKMKVGFHVVVIIQEPELVFQRYIQNSVEINYGLLAGRFLSQCEICYANLLEMESAQFDCFNPNRPFRDAQHIKDFIFNQSSQESISKLLDKQADSWIGAVPLNDAQLAMIDFSRLCVDNIRQLCDKKRLNVTQGN